MTGPKCILRLLSIIEGVLSDANIQPPVICTPQEDEQCIVIQSSNRRENCVMNTRRDSTMTWMQSARIYWNVSKSSYGPLILTVILRLGSLEFTGTRLEQFTFIRSRVSSYASDVAIDANNSTNA